MALVGQRDVGVAPTQLGNLFACRRQTFAGAIDTDVRFHGVHHFLTQSRDGLRAVALVEQGLDAVLRLFRLRRERRVAAGGRIGLQMGHGAERRPPPEDQQFGQRVGAEPVGAVDADAGAFAGGEQSRQPSRGLHIGMDAAHHVMDDRANRNRLLDRVLAQVADAQIAHQRQPLVDFLFA